MGKDIIKEETGFEVVMEEVVIYGKVNTTSKEQSHSSLNLIYGWP